MSAEYDLNNGELFQDYTFNSSFQMEWLKRGSREPLWKSAINCECVSVNIPSSVHKSQHECQAYQLKPSWQFKQM